MNNKIEWFQEVLSLEPGSKVFFPLAKLFVQTGDHEAAVQTLRKGLDRHPDFLEARFMLVDLLVRLGLHGEAREHIEHVTEPLAEHPAFWKLWAQSLKQTNPDLSVFLMLVASNLTGTEIRWTDVVMEGLYNLSERLVGEPEPDETAEDIAAASPALRKPDRLLDMAPDKGADAAASVPPSQGPDEAVLAGDSLDDGVDEVAEVSDGPPRSGAIRTRTMADLLASQGDFSGARDIYADLLGRAVSEEDKRTLAERVAAMQAREEARLAEEPPASSEGKACTTPEAAAQGGEDVFGKHAKNRLISTLEALAARFEARVRS